MYGGSTGGYSENWQCPHGMVSAEHRSWGQNYEQTWVESAWTEGFTSSYSRMVEEATEAGAHGIVGVVDTSYPLADMGVLEFKVQGTAVRVAGGAPPSDGRPWTTYLAGQRLAKLVEAGYAPVSIAASVASVRVWANCVTANLSEGSNSMYSVAQPGSEIDQTVKAHSVVRHLARRAGAGPARARLPPRGGDGHHRARDGRRRCRAPVHPAGQPGAAIQGVRPHAAPGAHGAAAVTAIVPANPGLPAPRPVDLKAEMLRATRALGQQPPAKAARMMSDLSIDEELVLHSIGWEPVELVSGVSIHSVPYGVWNWGQGEITWASAAYARSFAHATERIHDQCTKAGAQGVVGVHVEVGIHRHHIDVALVGTAVRPVDWKGLSADPVFVSDLSGRDFALLHNSGWTPLGLAAGASFVYAPRRSMGTAMQPEGPERRADQLHRGHVRRPRGGHGADADVGSQMDGTGVVEVKVTEGPMGFAHHAVAFTAYGTVVRLLADEHRNVGARMILPMDDPVRSFEATSLGGG